MITMITNHRSLLKDSLLRCRRQSAPPECSRLQVPAMVPMRSVRLKEAQTRDRLHQGAGTHHDRKGGQRMHSEQGQGNHARRVESDTRAHQLRRE